MRRLPRLGGFGARCATMLVAASAACLLAWTFSSCRSAPPQTTVGRGIPPKTQSDLGRARTDMIRAVTAFGLDYDERVCSAAKQRAKAEDVRIAVSEAYLSLTRGIERARREVRTRQTGDTASEETERDEIVWMTTRPSDEDASPNGDSAAKATLSWSCMGADEQKSCVQAAAGDVVESFYRAHVPQANVRASTLAELLAVLAEDFEWGLRLVREHRSLAKAQKTIRTQCNAGRSPLAHFLRKRRAEQTGRAQKTSIDMFASRLIHEERNVCDTLPVTYSNLVDLLRKRIEQRMIEEDCSPDDWQLVSR